MNAKKELRAEIIACFEKSLGKPLPIFLNRSQIDRSGIRSRASLEKDACVGTGLLPTKKVGGKNLYLLDAVVDFAVGSVDGIK